MRLREIFQLGSFLLNWLFESGQMSSATQPTPASFDQQATSPSRSRTMTGISIHISLRFLFFFPPSPELRWPIVVTQL